MALLALAVLAAGVTTAAIAGGQRSSSSCAPKKLLPLGKSHHRLLERRCPAGTKTQTTPASTPTTPTNTTTSITPPDTPPPARLQVLAREYSFTLSRRTIPAGRAIVELANQGEDGHDLVIEPETHDGNAAPVLTIPETPSGTHPDGDTTLAPGTYRLFCDLPGHASLGMEATLEVTAP